MISDEFAEAVPLEKLHRYRLSVDGTVCFGLLGHDGVLRYFSASKEAISSIAAESYDLARASRHIANGNDFATFAPSTLPGPAPLGADGFAPPFEGPALKILRALEHLDQLADLVDRYGTRAALTPVEIENDGETVTWEMQLSETPPGAIPLLIGDCVHNLRSALDIMICDVARLRGLGTRQFKFPFTENGEKLEKILQAEHAKIGFDVCDAIRILQPYKGGNELLRGLHDLDVIDKHRLALPVYFAQWRRHDVARRVLDGMRADNPDKDLPHIIWVSDLEDTPMPVGERIKRPIGEDPLKYYEEIKSPTLIRFPGGEDMPFPHSFVLETLSDLHHMVHEIFAGFLAKFGDGRTDTNLSPSG